MLKEVMYMAERIVERVAIINSSKEDCPACGNSCEYYKRTTKKIYIQHNSTTISERVFLQCPRCKNVYLRKADITAPGKKKKGQKEKSIISVISRADYSTPDELLALTYGISKNRAEEYRKMLQGELIDVAELLRSVDIREKLKSLERESSSEFVSKKFCELALSDDKRELLKEQDFKIEETNEFERYKILVRTLYQELKIFSVNASKGDFENIDAILKAFATVLSYVSLKSISFSIYPVDITSLGYMLTDDRSEVTVDLFRYKLEGYLKNKIETLLFRQKFVPKKYYDELMSCKKAIKTATKEERNFLRKKIKQLHDWYKYDNNTFEKYYDPSGNTPLVVWVYRGENYCSSNHKEYIEEVVAEVENLERTNKINLSITWCKKCCCASITESYLMSNIQRYGQLRVKIEKYIADSGEYDGESIYDGWNRSSIYKIYGYDVSKNHYKTDQARQCRMVEIIESGLVEDKSELMDHINWLIPMHRKNSKMQEAVRCWESDLMFLTDYKNNCEKKIFADIVFKYKGNKN